MSDAKRFKVRKVRFRDWYEVLDTITNPPTHRDSWPTRELAESRCAELAELHRPIPFDSET